MLIQFEKHAAIGRLAAGVAHEILNPASIISSRLQFLEEENLSEPARENMRVSREQLQRIVKISNDLLQSSAKKPRVLVRNPPPTFGWTGFSYFWDSFCSFLGRLSA